MEKTDLIKREDILFYYITLVFNKLKYIKG